MFRRKSIVIVAGVLALTLHVTSSIRPALAGPAWGPPGWPNGPLDPAPPPRPTPSVDPSTGTYHADPSTGTVHGQDPQPGLVG